MALAQRIVETALDANMIDAVLGDGVPEVRR